MSILLILFRKLVLLLHNNMTTKICTKCKIEKNMDEYHIRDKKGNRHARCKPCRNADNRAAETNEVKERRSKKQKEDRKNNPEKFKKIRRERYLKNKDQEKAYAIKNSNKISARMKEYDKKNKRKHQDKKNKWAKERRKNNPAFAVMQDTSRQISFSLEKMGASKNGKSCWEKLPYTPQELIKHIEKHFSDPENLTSDGKVWMTWENRGLYKPEEWNDNDQSTWVWNIDHIEPQADLTFDSYEHPNFTKCWALSNLHPLSAKQNVLDGSKRTRHKNKTTTNRK
jgi:hypothetical protein